jgi:putative transposase
MKGGVTMIKGFKIRIYPTKEQEELIWRHIHASRFIWNYMLDLQEKNYDDGGKFISAFSMNKLLTPLKKREEYVWLNDVSTTMLQRTCADLAEAYNKYFKKIVNHPRYKSRKTAKKAFPVCCNRFSFNGNIAHIQKLGYVKFKSDFEIFDLIQKMIYLNINYALRVFVFDFLYL